jgi:anaerobic selenocysteine-containing dehydrogenase
MKLTRRDLLKLAGGGAVGFMFSPIPWKLLRDSSVWTQNWPWIPVPARGPVTTRLTACTLCPAGCGVKVRCVGGQPVSLSGIPNDPITRGGLCAAGIGAHHLAWHPARALRPLQRVVAGKPGEFTDVSHDGALAQIASAILGARGTVAILDEQPGRAISAAYREFLSALPRGAYLAPPAVARSSLAVLRGLYARDPGPLGHDLDSTRLIVSFGAPVLDGWGVPGAVARRVADGDLKVIQVEPCQSATAKRADRWIPIRPGTEGTVALGLAALLVSRGMADPAFLKGDVAGYLDALRGFQPAYVKEISGVDEATLTSIAMELTRSTPAIVVGGGDAGGGPLPRQDEVAIQALNLVLGAVGRKGGILARQGGAVDSFPGLDAAPPPMDIADVPDGSLDVLILDASSSGSALSWPVVASKLAPNALVVSLSPVVADGARYARLVLPTPSPMTLATDVPGHPDAADATLRMAVAFGTPARAAVDPVVFLNRLGTAVGIVRKATAAASMQDLVDQRIAAVHQAGLGTVLGTGDAPEVPVSSLSGASDLGKLLTDGGCWRNRGQADSPLPPHRITAIAAWMQPAPAVRDGYPMTLILTGSRGRAVGAISSPMLSKVDQESGLRQTGQMAAVNPRTAAAQHLVAGKAVVVQTPQGVLAARVKLDPGVPPDCVRLTVAPLLAPGRNDVDPLSLCAVTDRATWRLVEARIREA